MTQPYSATCTSIKVGELCTSIGDKAFYGFSNASNVDINDSVTSIGASAFTNCSKITEIKIPSGVTNINNHTFYGCSNLVSVELPNGLTSITGTDAFRYCSKLTNIPFPIGLKSIGYGTFRNCSKLPNVSIPNVTSIAREAFAMCSSITEFIVPSGVKQYPIELLMSTSVKVLDIPDTVTSFDSGGYNCCLMRILEKVIISSNIPTIPINCFLNCYKLTIVIIKNSSCTLANKNAFNETPMVGSGVGKIYVPHGYGDEFKSRANWSTYESHIYELNEDGSIPT